MLLIVRRPVLFKLLLLLEQASLLALEVDVIRIFFGLALVNSVAWLVSMINML